MSEIQLHPKAEVELVFFHIFPLEIHAVGDHVFILIPDRRLPDFSKQFLTIQDRSLNDLRAPVPVFDIGKGIQHLRIDQDEKRLVKGADLVLSARKVHGGLSADRRINTGKQCCRDLHEADAALVGCSCKTCHIARDTAAERNDQVTSRKSFLSGRL